MQSCKLRLTLWRNVWNFTFVGFSLLALGGCATIIKGHNQTLSVFTNPSGATCTLTRDSETVGVANPTPASVVLDRSVDTANVICKKDGYFDEMSTLSSSFHGMTFGNVLLGGLIGVAVDAASGAMYEYPESITISLTPKSFSSAAARDEFFDGRLAQIKQDAATAVADVQKNCDSNDQDCDALVKAINTNADAQIDKLNAQRNEASIN